jgi:predicted CopG family antitoxin
MLIIMTSRNISIREDLYKKLSQLKQPNESFSDVIQNILDEGSKGSFSRLMKYFGSWSDFPDDFFQENFGTPDTREGLSKSINARIQQNMGNLK